MFGGEKKNNNNILCMTLKIIIVTGAHVLYYYWSELKKYPRKITSMLPERGKSEKKESSTSSFLFLPQIYATAHLTETLFFFYFGQKRLKMKIYSRIKLNGVGEKWNVSID